MARETLADKVELCDIYRALTDKAEMHGLETLPQTDQDTLNNRSLDALEKQAASARSQKITKASNRVSAQKLVEYATEALRKYSAKPGKNRVCYILMVITVIKLLFFSILRRMAHIMLKPPKLLGSLNHASNL